MIASVPLFLEYEAVLMRDEHLAAANASPDEINNLLDALADVAEPAEIRFLWRPQLKDVDDEMVLEAAVNGDANSIVTFNRRHFAYVAHRFGVEIMIPSEAIARF